MLSSDPRAAPRGSPGSAATAAAAATADAWRRDAAAAMHAAHTAPITALAESLKRAVTDADQHRQHATQTYTSHRTRLERARAALIADLRARQDDHVKQYRRILAQIDQDVHAASAAAGQVVEAAQGLADTTTDRARAGHAQSQRQGDTVVERAYATLGVAAPAARTGAPGGGGDGEA
ncbi:hypothetical protein GGF31_002638 [Allomyces arbusculus]|nr:hypothetical protein GGF31_002638 [Allomyces arbusculus]